MIDTKVSNHCKKNYQKLSCFWKFYFENHCY